MLSVLRTRMYWKGMDKQVAAFVKGCQVCIHKNLKKADYPQLRIRPPIKPFVRLALDCWKADGQAALTAICLSTQYPFAEKLDHVDADCVCNAFSNILAQIPTPAEIVTDNGTEFNNEKFKHLLKARNIQHIDIAAHSPQSNGVLEKWHRYLNKEYGFIRNHGPKQDWWSSVRAVVETYRKTPHTRTMESPMFLALGHEPIYSIDHLLPTLDRAFWDENDAASGLQQLRTAMAHARKNLALARQRSKVVLRQHARPLKVGDRVFRMNFSRNRSKVDTKWLAGYRILEFLTSRTVRVVHTRTGKTHRVNLRHLRWADPISELLDNTNIDCFPGESKLYFQAGDLEDLNWEPFVNPEPLPEHLQQKMSEIVRDRSQDTGPQVPIPMHVDESHDTLDDRMHADTPQTYSDTLTPQNLFDKKGGGSTHARERRTREKRKPKKLKDYVCGVAFRPNVLIHTDHSD